MELLFLTTLSLPIMQIECLYSWNLSFEELTHCFNHLTFVYFFDRPSDCINTFEEIYHHLNPTTFEICFFYLLHQRSHEIFVNILNKHR